MYNYTWNPETNGYTLTNERSQSVSNEIRPVFAPELVLTGLNSRLRFPDRAKGPLLWAKQTSYFYKGEEIASLPNIQYGKDLTIEWKGRMREDEHCILTLQPVNLPAMLRENEAPMRSLVLDTLKRIKEMYNQYAKKCDVVYIGFSCGKDSMVLLSLCALVLPRNVPVVFSDTDMELPDSYSIWEKVQKKYPDRLFFCAKANRSALQNWRLFGPPSRVFRWCCAVHKSAPALLTLRQYLNRDAIKQAAVFVGVRHEESFARSAYESDIGEGVKNPAQTNLCPLLDWSAHEIWLYTFQYRLLINEAYKHGLHRVGCVFCPESSSKYTWFVDANYPNLSKKYMEIVIHNSSKTFISEADKTFFLGGGQWQCRRSGLALKHNILQATETEIIDDDSRIVTWRGLGMRPHLFLEWLKSIGSVLQDIEHGFFWLIVGQGYVMRVEVQAQQIQIRFPKLEKCRKFLPFLHSVLHKAQACIACQLCESVCPTGALSSARGRISIDETKCIHCLRCHNPDYGCWRYHSMVVPRSTTGTLKNIGAYTNFGMRTDFVAEYVKLRENLNDTSAMNRAKQVPAAKVWFRQAQLMEANTMQPTRLLDLFAQRGVDAPLAWHCVWMGLCNYAPIMKWFATCLKLDQTYSNADLYDLLGSDIGESTKRGGLQAMKSTFRHSPLSSEDEGICELIFKGKNIQFLKRKSCEVKSEVVLYGLYLMAEKTKRSSFTVRQMLDATMESEVVSPLVAFGMQADRFKGHCNGLAARYPDFISCNFTLGLDEILLHPDQKNLTDVINLCMRSK